MSHSLSKTIVQKASRCNKALACLEEGGAPYCKVEHVVNAEMNLVKCLYPESCNYQINFGEGHLCTCPVRIALWAKHRI